MPCPRDPSRTGITGRAYAGSQRQIQTYVNERTSELCHAVAEALQPCKLDELVIRWVSPLAADNHSEYRDEEFLEIIGAGHLAPRLRDFWPQRGPCWDALAQLDGGGCVLVEAKSHVPAVPRAGRCHSYNRHWHGRRNGWASAQRPAASPILSECAVARPELWIALADSSVNTRGYFKTLRRTMIRQAI